ncbi:MAG TPA: NUDIX domain-containing protein [Blastocatellia bacterium]|nr:NUDIX domain-containing protein [Blastocatellia bacterium]
MSSASKKKDYPRPSVTVDLVIFTIAEDDLRVLLIRRKQEPFKDRWALPGGFVEIDESLERAAARELEEEVGVKDVYLEQLYTFGDPGRDPRGRVISVAYFALIDAEQQSIVAADDAADAAWHSVFHPPRLAFDHSKVLEYAVWRLRNKLEWTTVGYELLPKKFTLSELQRVYEIILQRPVDKRNFRKKILAQGRIRELQETRTDGAHRPARLYTFVKRHQNQAAQAR